MCLCDPSLPSLLPHSLPSSSLPVPSLPSSSLPVLSSLTPSPPPLSLSSPRSAQKLRKLPCPMTLSPSLPPLSLLGPLQHTMNSSSSPTVSLRRLRNHCSSHHGNVCVVMVTSNHGNTIHIYTHQFILFM